MKNFFAKNFSFIHIIGVVLGAIGGYLYYYFVGCSTGTCALKSNPYIMVGYGVVFGYFIFDLLFSLYNKYLKKNKTDNNKSE